MRDVTMHEMLTGDLWAGVWPAVGHMGRGLRGGRAGLGKGSGSISIQAEGSWEERGVIHAKMAKCFWAAVQKAPERPMGGRLKRVCGSALGKSRVSGIRWRNELRGEGRPEV